MASYATEKKLGVTYVYMDGREAESAVKTVEVANGVNIDFGADGKPNGIELVYEALEPVVGYEHG